MAEGFRVDVGALRKASDGVDGVLLDVRAQKVNDIGPESSAVGHDRLAAAGQRERLRAGRARDQAEAGHLPRGVRPGPSGRVMADLGETIDPKALVPGDFSPLQAAVLD